MRISVKVKAGAKEEKIKEAGQNSYSVAVKAPPKEGKANEAVIKILAGYFKISPSRVKIVTGQRSKQKLIDII